MSIVSLQMHNTLLLNTDTYTDIAMDYINAGRSYEYVKAKDWIEITEATPPLNKDIICWCKESDRNVEGFRVFNFYSNGHVDSLIELYKITHWQEVIAPVK